MDTSIFTFPTDFAGETVPTVLGRIRDEAGADEVVIAANYHTARDLFVHNPVYKVHASRGGVLYLDAALARATRIGAACEQDEIAAGPCSFPNLVVAAQAAGLRARAWLNFCHLDNWAVPPTTLCRNAFGDLDYSTVCPANPEVAEFAVALTRDAAAGGADGIVAEATCFAPLVHGYHHERWLGGISELARFLLGLCFCESCRQGIDAVRGHVSALVDAVRACIDDELEAADAQHPTRRAANDPAGAVDDPPLTVEHLRAAVGEEIEPLLAHRERAVSELVERIAVAAQDRDVPVCFVDPSGALKGYVTGQVSGPPGPVPTWVVGSDPVAFTRVGASVGILAYSTSVDRVRDELGAYSELLGGLRHSTIVLRPAPPDCSTADDLVGKVETCRDLGVRNVGFYHYALFPLKALRWIRQALGT